MHKLVSAFVVAFVLLSIACAFMEGGGGVVSTRLTAPMTITEVASMTVANTTGYMSSGILFIDNEKMAYAGKPDTTHFTGLTRGIEETTATIHLVNARVYNEPAGIINVALGFNVVAITASGSKFAAVDIGWKFVTKTLPKLILWDFPALFQGELAILRYILMAISIAFYLTFAIQLLNALLQVFKP